MPTLYDVAHFCSWNGYTEDMRSYLGVDTAAWTNREFWSPHGANLLYGPDKKSRIQIICENGQYYDFKGVEWHQQLPNKYNAVARIRELIADGAKPDVKDVNGWSGLLVCARNGWTQHLDIMKILMDAGADINQKSNIYGFMPLTLSSANGHIEIVKELILRGADVNLPDKVGMMPITYAAENGHLDIVKKLFAAGAVITNDVFESAIRGRNIAVLKYLLTIAQPPADSVFYATYYKQANMIKVLAKAGSDMNQDFPVQWAVSEGYNDCLKALCAGGASINILDQANDTPLRQAILTGNHEAIGILAAYKADINDVSHSRPLIHYAISMYSSFPADQRKRCLLEIIKAGPNFKILDQNGDTPAAYASNHGMNEIVILIKRAELKQQVALGLKGIRNNIKISGNK
jgi:hypothetical protein